MEFKYTELENVNRKNINSVIEKKGLDLELIEKEMEMNRHLM